MITWHFDSHISIATPAKPIITIQIGKDVEWSDMARGGRDRDEEKCVKKIDYTKQRQIIMIMLVEIIYSSLRGMCGDEFNLNEKNTWVNDFIMKIIFNFRKYFERKELLWKGKKIVK